VAAVIGTDISEHQSVGAGLFGEFVVVRASNGRRRDYKVFQHVAAARSRGLPVSLYTYCEPANNSPEFQADLLCGVAAEAGISKATTLWCDLEEGAGDLRWFEDRFIAGVNRAGWPCDTYSGDYFWRAHGLQGRGNPWKAAYGNNDGRPHNPPSQPWAIWQYTSVPLDTNTADAAVIVQLFRGAQPPAPAESVVEDLLLEQ
jgi:hypothetical protein